MAVRPRWKWTISIRRLRIEESQCKISHGTVSIARLPHGHGFRSDSFIWHSLVNAKIESRSKTMAMRQTAIETVSMRNFTLAFFNSAIA